MIEALYGIELILSAKKVEDLNDNLFLITHENKSSFKVHGFMR